MPTTVYGQRDADKFITGKHVDLVVVTCTCGILFAIPENLHRSALKHRGPTGWQISCPLGHTWHFTAAYVDEEAKLRNELERERRYSAHVVARLDQAEASLSATRGVVTRMKRRASAGVCPCCNRTFQQLARHMATKHPDFSPPSGGHLPHDRAPARQDRVGPLLDFLGEGERTYTEIRDHLGITGGHMSILTHRLVKSGEIERVRRGVYRRPT